MRCAIILLATLLGWFTPAAAGTVRHEQANLFTAGSDCFSSNIDKAIEGFTLIINRDEKSKSSHLAVAYFDRGNKYLEQGNNRSAISDYDRSIELDSNNAEAYGNRGFAYSRISEDDHALADLDKAIELNPQNWEFYNSRGDVFARKGDYERSISEFQRAIELGSHAANYRLPIKVYLKISEFYLKKGDYNAAIKNLNELLKKDPNNFTARIKLAEIDMQRPTPSPATPWGSGPSRDDAHPARG